MHSCWLLLVLWLGTTQANLSGPYLLWGNEKVINLQPRALVEATETDFVSLFEDVTEILLFVRNTTKRLDGGKYPHLQEVVKNNAWSYLPQRSLAADLFKYNPNIKIINLSDLSNNNDVKIVSAFENSVRIYGAGKVLGILASREEEAHFLTKRAAKASEDEKFSTTAQPPAGDETDESFIYVAEGNKAILYVNSAPLLTFGNSKEPIKLLVHNKAITFDDQRAKGYGRLNIIFNVDGEKAFLRFNFTLTRGTWTMKAVEIDFKGDKNVLPIVGHTYNVPSAPVGFSYRCSSRQMVFNNGTDTLVLNDYQVQPWLNGAIRFGDVYDCVGFTSAPIWAGIFVSFLLVGILSIGILALMDIKPPNRFESSRTKQLTFTVQE